MRKEKLCIRTPQIYDWVRRKVELPTIRFTELDHRDDCGCNKGENDPCKIITNSKSFLVKCFLSDANGDELNPTDKHAFNCFAYPIGQNISTTLPSGQVIDLQKVKVTISGFIVIEIINSFGFTICISIPIPFSTTQIFTLCLPEGTFPICEITSFKCTTDLVCSKKKFDHIDVCIKLYIDIQSITNIKLQIDGVSCTARSDIEIDLDDCPSDLPPSPCPKLSPS
ncbi:hypothetical protein BKP37_14520 [Anaerobacillus alkalilacustris]|uniref:DUF3794 domain-containing protein n=1 Tax=Anaerobacillus alkalilacustris TaxID=393763 RepID=A0A1S2LI63_9BACI|nr:hypothetical protein [Anaerobacillus alkalilacustris]OIJ12091.1 hypothetical protein BKP37_14520 [Anaerobacillus alkalilacustris]